MLYIHIHADGVEKDHFNRRVLKVVAKDTKLKHCKYVLCDHLAISLGDLCG
jgi:hypothetical protein